MDHKKLETGGKRAGAGTKEMIQREKGKRVKMLAEGGERLFSKLKHR